MPDDSSVPKAATRAAMDHAEAVDRLLDRALEQVEDISYLRLVVDHRTSGVTTYSVQVRSEGQDFDMPTPF